ncbi:MAG: DUF234 domain-containing protein [Ruminococcus sp.]
MVKRIPRSLFTKLRIIFSASGIDLFQRTVSIIARGATDLAYSRIESHLSEYMGLVFEEICRQYLWKLLLTGECPVEFSELGRWWGNDPRTRSQSEIDIMGEADKNTALFGECKWTNERWTWAFWKLLWRAASCSIIPGRICIFFQKADSQRGAQMRHRRLEM